VCSKEGRTSSLQCRIWQKGHGGEHNIKALEQIAASCASRYRHGFEQSHWTEHSEQENQMDKWQEYIHVIW
jgi:hypothetical protein